jgi:non-heme chloroperoxidase
VRADRSQYFMDLAIPFYGLDRAAASGAPAAHPDQHRGLIEAFWRLAMQCGIKAAYDCIAQFSETDFSEDLRRVDVPTLIVHGDADQIVPIGAAALRSVELVPRVELLVYEGAPHGLAQTQADRFNADLLAFIERQPRDASQGRRGAGIDAARSRGRPSSPDIQTGAKPNPG